MWERLPIQRTRRGPSYSFIEREHTYELYEDVQVKTWKSVPTGVKRWAQSLWQDGFKVRRNPANAEDILAWIPRKGVLLAKYGQWIGADRSTYMVYMCYNYVARDFRGEGVSEELVLSLCHECTRRWGPVRFVFELQSVPRSLADATPIVRFSYVWVPFLSIQSPPRWTPVSVADTMKGLERYHGFHTAQWAGYRAFEYKGMKIVLDPHNDVVYYDDYTSLLTFDGIPISGAYCRVFSPLGGVRIYVENMYFEPETRFEHYLLV